MISPICMHGPRSPAGRWLDRNGSDIGLLTGEGPPLAATPHYRAAAPISGGVEAAKVDFWFEMKIERVDEKPRVTFPFSDKAWAALDALGERVDADLVKQDVRLTMGGEPTFVSIDDYQTAEWNTAALGPTKRILADKLISRLSAKFAPGGSSIMDRANGIQASRCRAGRSRCSGAWMASRSGRTQS